MSFRNEVLRGLKWTATGRLTSQIVTWGVTIMLLRLLNPEDYGLMALASIFSALFTLLAEVGLGPTLVQNKDLTPQRVKQIFGLVILTNAAAALTMAFVVSPLVAMFFGEERLQLVIQVIALQFVPAAFAIVPGALLERNLEFRGKTIADLVSNIGGSLLMLWLAYHGFGVMALAWGSLGVATIRAVGLNIARPMSMLPSFDFKGCGGLFNFAGNVTGTQLIWFTYSQADLFIIGKFLGKHDLGIYSVSMDVASLPASRVSAILNQVVFPSLSKVQREGGPVSYYMLVGLRTISLLSFPVMWGLSSVAPELVQVLMGDKWLESVTPLALLCLIMPLRVLSPLLHSGLYAVGRADRSFNITFITAVVMCLSFLVGAQFGLLGLSLAWLVAFPAVFLMNLIGSGACLGLTTGRILGALSRPALASVVMYAAVAGSRLAVDAPAAVKLGALIAIGAATYLLVSWWLNREGLVEVRGLLRRKAL